MREMKEKQIKSFWKKVKKTELCWEWIGSKTPLGYGRLVYDRYAHRVSWEISNGKIPQGYSFSFTFFSLERGRASSCAHSSL